MTRKYSPVKHKELLAEAHYNKVKSDLAREAMDYFSEHGYSSQSKEYRTAYSRMIRCLKRRNHLLKLAEGMTSNGTR